MYLKKGQNRKKLPKDFGTIASVQVRLKLYHGAPICHLFEAHFQQINDSPAGRPEYFTVDQKTRELVVKPIPDKRYELRIVYYPALKEC